jgi:hypothetical protein
MHVNRILRCLYAMREINAKVMQACRAGYGVALLLQLHAKPLIE